MTAVLGLGIHTLHRSGMLADAAAAAQEQLLSFTARLGLVVEDIYAEGRERTSERDIVRSLERYQGMSILAVDTAAAKERLESLPWVRRATVSRQFPTTLLVRIEEHRPLAVWIDSGRRRLIGDEGELVPVTDVRGFRELPVLRGAGAPARVHELFRILDAEPSLERRLTQATLVAERRWNVWLDHRIEVRLPEKGAEEAWRYLGRRQREAALLSRAIEAIDLRNPSWLALRLMDDKAPQAGQGV
jgi:cell division protein FtsQ